MLCSVTIHILSCRCCPKIHLRNHNRFHKLHPLAIKWFTVRTTATADFFLSRHCSPEPIVYADFNIENLLVNLNCSNIFLTCMVKFVIGQIQLTLLLREEEKIVRICKLYYQKSLDDFDIFFSFLSCMVTYVLVICQVQLLLIRWGKLVSICVQCTLLPREPFDAFNTFWGF